MIDAYLKLTAGGSGVAGEATDHVYNRAIELTDFNLGGYTNADVSDAGDPKRPKRYGLFGFEVKKLVDRASPFLFKAYCTTFSQQFLAEHNLFNKAEVVFRKAGGPEEVEYMKMQFDQVLLTSYGLDVWADGTETETIRFAFQAVQMSYQQQGPEGAAVPREVKGWDYATNRAR